MKNLSTKNMNDKCLGDDKKLKHPRMWRKRYIPDEIIDISKDQVLYRDERLIITTWEVINPRSDFQTGISYVYLKQGIKISKLFKEDGEFVKYYCDIIDVEYNEEKDEYVFVDLLLDVIILPNNETKILDMDELIEAEKEGLITTEKVHISIKRLQTLLEMIYSNDFPPKEVKEHEEGLL